jgi:thioredoxin-dependent peroxiredoxin
METGDVVPDFELPDETGKVRRFSEFLASGPVVLFTYPIAMSKGCTVESCYFRDLASEFQAVGASRVGLSGDSVDRQAVFSSRHDFDYPLLSDQTGEVTKMLGVRRGLARVPVRRWTFVIARDATVLEVIKSEVSMHRHADRALEVLSAGTE